MTIFLMVYLEFLQIVYPMVGGNYFLIDNLMSKGINFHDITPLDRLCYVGKFGIGALSYEPIYEEIKNIKEQTNIILLNFN
jgi:hypothetical protein